MERGDLFPGMISREIDVPYVKIDIPMTAVFLRSWGCRLFSRGVGWWGGGGIFRFPPKLTVSHFQMEDLKILISPQVADQCGQFDVWYSA